MSNQHLLLEAVKNNDLDGTRNLIESGYNILEKDDCGMTALHWASYLGHFEIAKLLIEMMSNNMYNINDTGMLNTNTYIPIP